MFSILFYEIKFWSSVLKRMLNAVQLSSEIKISRGRQHTGRYQYVGIDTRFVDSREKNFNSKVLTLSITQQFRHHYLHFNRKKIGARCAPVRLVVLLALASSASRRIGGWRAGTTQSSASAAAAGAALGQRLIRRSPVARRVVSLRRWPQ